MQQLIINIVDKRSDEVATVILPAEKASVYLVEEDVRRMFESHQDILESLQEIVQCAEDENSPLEDTYIMQRAENALREAGV